MQNWQSVRVLASAMLIAMPALAVAQVVPGTYTGTLTCGAMQGPSSRPGWSDKVQVEIQNSRLTWTRSGVVTGGEKAEYRETGNSKLTSDNTAFLEAEGRYMPGSTRTGTWLTSGTLALESGHLVGEQIVQMDSTRMQIFRNCTVSIPVTVASAPNQVPKQAAVRLPVAPPPARPPIAVPKPVAETATPSVKSETRVALPIAGMAYVCLGDQNFLALFAKSGRYFWGAYSGVLASSEMKDLYARIGTWERITGGIGLIGQGEYYFERPAWDTTETRVNYSVEHLDSGRFVLKAGSDRVLKCHESPENTEALQGEIDRAFVAFEKLDGERRKTEADRQKRLARYAHIKSMDDVTALLAPMHQSIEKMKADPRCRGPAIAMERQLDSLLGQMARLQTLPAAQRIKPWSSYGEIAESYSSSAAQSLKACTKR